MDAIVLVGGLGTRLRPLTAERHKSLVPVLNRPAISYLFDWLRESGVSRVVLALGQQNEDLADAYPEGNYDGLELVIVRETARLESGGAIRHAVQTAGVTGRFLVLNGDIFARFDLRHLISEHEAKGGELTLALYPVDDPSSFGVAVVDDDGVVTGFVEKPPPGEAPSNLINAGIWLFEPGLVGEIPPGAVRVEETLFPSLVARRRKVLGYRFGGVWADIGTSARYLALNAALLPGETTAVSPTATIEESASVGGSAIGDGVVVGPHSSVAGSVVWEDVTIGHNCVVEDSVIANGVVVGDGAVLRGVVIGCGAEIPAGSFLKTGETVEAHSRYHASNE